MLGSAVQTSDTWLNSLEPISKRLLGVWLDTSWDTPADFNSRLGFNASAFHFAHTIPTNEDLPPIELLDASDTDAALYLSVFPKFGLAVISDDDLAGIINTCVSMNERGRKVYLRFAPGMFFRSCSLMIDNRV